MSAAFLILEDKTVFSGKSIGVKKDVICEMVFNTAMTGYQEAISDPSYAGQGLIFTFPLIGNYGINIEDYESRYVFTSALIVRELSRRDSNFRSEGNLEGFLVKHNIPGIEGIDTRALTSHLRNKGTMVGMITFDENYDIDAAIKKIKAYKPEGLIKKVSTGNSYLLGDEGDKTVAVIDFGCKNTISNALVSRGFRVMVYPAHTPAEDIINISPDGIVLTNGPGDPKDCNDLIENIKKLYNTDIPILAISLGHQLMAIATGADTRKLKYGHRGANQPVRDLKTNRVYITSQNHGYVVDENTVNPKIAKARHINVNDNTVEGLSYVGKKIISVQFQLSPGPHDTDFLFDDFIKTMGGQKHA